MTSATENMRRLLAERGIEWRSGLEGVTFVGDWCFVEYDEGKLAATCEPVLTIEQAIAATLGSGTCTRVKSGTKPDGSPRYRCSNCKYGIGDKRWSYCPNCGRKVEHE